jgi:hypothetical protein
MKKPLADDAPRPICDSMPIRDDRYQDEKSPHRFTDRFSDDDRRAEPGATPGSAEGERNPGNVEADPIGRTAGSAEGERK